MVRALVLATVLGLLGSAAGVKTADIALVEATRKCAEKDYLGMIETLVRRGEPLGIDNGKGLLRSCFADSDGKCLLNPQQCAWMKKCLLTDGPCERLPIADAFQELPGGKASLLELMKEFNPNNNETEVDIPIWKLMAATMKTTLVGASANSKKVRYEVIPKEEGGKKDASALVQTDARAQQEPDLSELGVNDILKIAQFLRNLYLTEMMPERSQRVVPMHALSLIAWFLAACATKTTGVKHMGVGNKDLIFYSHYMPLGVGKQGEHVGPVYNTKIETDPQEWACKTGTKLYNQGIWEGQYGKGTGIPYGAGVRCLNHDKTVNHCDNLNLRNFDWGGTDVETHKDWQELDAINADPRKQPKKKAGKK